MEDCCAVCAEPLEWTAYGPCGHTEACSKCVIRLRFVMDDKRCVICQQINPCVLVTRFMGSYTSTLTAAEFPSLGRQAGLDYLASTQAYFDDKLHFEEIRGLCSFSHPELKDDNGQMLVFRSISQLKRQLGDTKHVQLCNICVENRKVFIPEQVAYSKPDLERHMRSGDLTGPMAESGFKGHPQCRFCRTRFFSDSELYIHMQSAHEQCFLCRRAHPNRFIYYKDYNELEDHFRHEHYLCNHQLCLDRKFIVFMTEQELKQHAAREHGGDMSKAERRQALTIPINFQYSRGAEAAGGPSGRGRHEVGGPSSITIGGSGNVRSRFALRAPEDTHHLSSAIHASVESAQTEDAMRASAAASSVPVDPTPAEAEGQAFSGPRHYLAAAGSRGGGNLRAEDFPALPGTSKSAKKRSKDKEKQQPGGQRSMSELDLAGSSARALAQSSSTPDFHEGAETMREPEWQEVRAPAQRQLAQQQRLSKLQGRAAAAAAKGAARRPEADPFPPINGGVRSAGSSRTVSPGPIRGPAAADLPASNGASPAATSSSAREVFPALGPPTAAARQPNLRSWGPGSSAAPEQRQAPQKQRSQAEDFPVLGKAAPASGRPGPQPAASVSDSTKAANKALLKKVKAQLSEAQLDEFRREASSFLQGATDAPTYHQLVVSLGLGAMVPEMAALLPDEDRRAELVSAHSAAQQPSLAADAAAAHAMQFGSWQCSRCSLINGPDTRSCEACNSKRPQGASHGSSNGSTQQQEADGADEDGFPSLGTDQASSSSGKQSEKESKQQRKGKKVSKFERLRLTGGDPEATLAWMDTEGGRKPPTNPQNAWTQGRPAGSVGSSGNQARGQWSKQGKLAHEWKTIQDAWSHKWSHK